jgi:hypothetical protein
LNVLETRICGHGHENCDYRTG